MLEQLSNYEKAILFMIKSSPGLCKTQIRKGLFIIDSLYYALYKKTFTDCKYIKEKYGPVPDKEHFLMLKSTLDKYTEEIIKQKGFYEKSEFYLKDNSIDLKLDECDLKLLKKAINYISNKTAKELSELIHGKVYHSTFMNEYINIKDVVQWIIDSPNEVYLNNELRELTKEDEAEILTICRKN